MYDEALKGLYEKIKNYESEPCGSIRSEGRTYIKQACKMWNKMKGKKDLGCALCGKKQIIKTIGKYLKGKGLV